VVPGLPAGVTLFAWISAGLTTALNFPDRRGMIERYALPEMTAHLGGPARFERWLQIEIHAVEAGAWRYWFPWRISRRSGDNARFDIERIQQHRACDPAKNDVIAFLHQRGGKPGSGIPAHPLRMTSQRHTGHLPGHPVPGRRQATSGWP
jgi:hypothetical protein